MQDSNANPTPEALPDATAAEIAVPPTPTIDQAAADHFSDRSSKNGECDKVEKCCPSDCNSGRKNAC